MSVSKAATLRSLVFFRRGPEIIWWFPVLKNGDGNHGKLFVITLQKSWLCDGTVHFLGGYLSSLYGGVAVVMLMGW